jgi:hypothetical protein
MKHSIAAVALVAAASCPSQGKSPALEGAGGTAGVSRVAGYRGQ